jgi:acyl carrier protein phosphodiesterase
MEDNINSTFEQAAGFQKLWMESFANMAGVWSQYSPASPPPEELRKMRTGMLKVLSNACDDFMRTPQFMEMMKISLNAGIELRRMAKEGMNRIHEQFETPSREDIDGVLLAIRHIEQRVLDRMEGLDERMANLADLQAQLEKLMETIAKVDGRMGKLEERIGKMDDHMGGIEERFGKLDTTFGQVSKSNQPPGAPLKKRPAAPRE